MWILLSWYSSEFWRQNLDTVPCSVEQMNKVAEGAFILGQYYRNRIDERGIAGLTGNIDLVELDTEIDTH